MYYLNNTCVYSYSCVHSMHIDICVLVRAIFLSIILKIIITDVCKHYMLWSILLNVVTVLCNCICIIMLDFYCIINNIMYHVSMYKDALFDHYLIIN